MVLDQKYRGNAPDKRSGHIVVSPYNAWGHVKPASALISKIVRRKGIYVTFIVSVHSYDKVKEEFDLRFEPGTENELKELIRIIGVESALHDFEHYIYQKNIVETCKKLVNGETLEIKPGSDKYVANVGPPTLYILDHMLKNYRCDTIGEVRKLITSRTPIYALAACGSTATFSNSAPEHIGGRGDVVIKLEALERLDEKTRKEEANKILIPVEKGIVKLPGLPEMYDHEFLPQNLPYSIDLSRIAAHNYRFFSESDGVVLNSNSDFEQPVIDAWKSWFVDKPVISPGPTDYFITEREKNPPSSNLDVTYFLDKSLEEHGPCSVFYISFGSVFWPTEPEKIWAILDILLERNIPFLFSHASPFAVIPPAVLSKIKESDFAFKSAWMPQNEILQHKACGWFVSHCGHNSVVESICAGVPMIAWPFVGDQPSNAAYVSSVHNIGYELFEVRSGYGCRPIARLNDYAPIGTVEAVRSEFSEILKKAYGDDGKEKRENVREFQRKIAENWKPDGACWKEIDRIISAALTSNYK